MPKKGENIRQRKDGRWEARFVKGSRKDGKPNICSIYGKSYFEVRDKRLEAILAYRETIEKKRTTKKEIAIEDLSIQWINQVRNTLRPSTYATYLSCLKNHIIPYFENIMFSKLNQDLLETFILGLQINGRQDGRGGLSSTSIILIQSIVLQIVRFGKSQGYYYTNLEITKVMKVKKKAIAVPTADELTKLECFLSQADEPCCFGILLCMYTGMRNGELCSLKWRDIDFENLIIYIKKTMQRLPCHNNEDSPKTKIVIGVPKSSASIRTIPIPTLLQSHVLKYKSMPDCFILTGTQKCMEPRQLRTRYQKYLKKCGIKNYHFHALRHAFATRCMEKGVDAKTLSELLGHTNISTTLDIYTHPSLELKRMYIERL